MLDVLFPPGTPVRITTTVQTGLRRDRPVETETVGTIEAWEELPTGSWFAGGKKDKLWLHRLKIRKLDGEITLLVIDDRTAIAKLEAQEKIVNRAT